MKALRASLLMPCIIGMFALIFLVIGVPALFSIKHTIISYDPLFSPAARAHIRDIIIADLPSRFSSAQVHALPELLPIISSASARFKANGTAYYSVQAWEPIWRVNDDRLLLSNNQLVDSKVIAAEVWQELPILHAQSEDPQLYEIIRVIPYDLADRYAITIADEHLIYLHDTHDKRFYVAAHKDAIGSLDSSVIDRIEQDVLSKQAKKKNDHGWIIDIRFAGQVVVRSYKGGVV